MYIRLWAEHCIISIKKIATFVTIPDNVLPVHIINCALAMFLIFVGHIQHCVGIWRIHKAYFCPSYGTCNTLLTFLRYIQHTTDIHMAYS